MRVWFSVVVCILIDSKVLPISAQETTTVYPGSTTPANTTTCSELDPPINITISTNQTSAVLIWLTTQSDSYCDPDTLDVSCVALPEENEDGLQWVNNSTARVTVVNGANETVITVRNLTEFTNYTCTAVLSEGDLSSNETEIKFQTECEVPTAPLNLRISGEGSYNFSIHWEEPLKNPGLFLRYHVHIKSFGPAQFVPSHCNTDVYERWDTTAVEQFTYWEAIPDYKYVATVFLENSAGNGSMNYVNLTTDTAASEIPTDVLLDTPELIVDDNILLQNISWNMPCRPNGQIEKFVIKLEGHYLDGDDISDNRTIPVPANNTDKYFETIELHPASTYYIWIRADGVKENGESYNETLSTEENWPGPPILENVSITEVQNVTITWQKPERKAGNITSYVVSLVPLGPLYDIDRTRCSVDEQTRNVTLTGTDMAYIFMDGLPYRSYNISVAAATSKGTGEPAATTLHTPATVPDKPEDLTFQLLNDNVTGIVQWKTPCSINGPINVFNITLTGNYSEEDFQNSTMEHIPVNYENNTYAYSSSITLLESYSYEVTVAVILQDGTVGRQTNATYFTTPDGYPQPPDAVDVQEINHESFNISWKRPLKRNGRILEYQVVVNPIGPLYETLCDFDDAINNYTVTGNETYYTFSKAEPYYNYSIFIIAGTSRGLGNASISRTVSTKPYFPENVSNLNYEYSIPTQEEYDASVNITFNSPCKYNGPSLNYTLILIGKRQNDSITNRMTSNSTSFYKISLMPEYNYEFMIQTHNGYYSSNSTSKTFTAPAGVPKFQESFHDIEIQSGTSSATFVLRNADFNNENGNIKYIAILLSEVNRTRENFSKWDDNTWPRDNVSYQLTEDFWNPFQDEDDNVTFTVGNGTCDKLYCNRALESGKDYYLTVRVFTKNFYKDSSTIHFRTENLSKLGLILGVIFGLLAFSLLGLAGFLIWRKNIVRLPTLFYPRKSSLKAPTTGNSSIPINKFVAYCKNLENNPEKFTEQYMLLTEKSKEIMSTHTTAIAELTENRRKNRYTNILPYDATRVKLLIDEDDEIGSDYINASYIRGYSGNIEYIATQGPLPTTCRDFWKMVIQENVSIIVMVTQFVEDNKEKCYKYFPNNHESMTIGDDMEIRCTMELHFGTYCVRTIQVKKDSTQVTVTHMQYLDWPDFNVPKGTDTMLQFCHQFRERLNMEGGYVIVHCSAGVGRTGTLIATDILIQNINAGKNIDIFNTVLELRKQRMIMVQAQKQYVYIHNLISDSLESQATGFSANMEPIYENQSALQLKSDDDNLIDKDKVKESQF